MYDLEYYENMLRNYSKTAEQICKIRWDFISEVRPKYVLDYGSGVGWFRAFRPKDVVVDSYDICSDYPQTEELSTTKYDVVCFWDVLEHLPKFNDIKELLNVTKYVAVTIPILPEGKNPVEWKHFKPEEHLHYWTKDVLKALFAYYGFGLLKEGQPECPPREDIWSFLFAKIEGIMLEGNMDADLAKTVAKVSSSYNPPNPFTGQETCEC